MGRIRKRIIKKKAIIKKNIKQSIKRKPQQAEHKLTSEQQAKQNEMLKVMLARPQQIVPQGTSQQNDELRQKLDSLTRQNTNQANENRELRRLISEGRADQQRINDEFRREQELNRQRDQNIRQREAAEDRLHEEQDRGQRLRERQDELDNSTEAGRHRQEMAELDTQIHNLSREREQNEAQISNNELYQKLLKKRADVDFLTESVSAQRDVINSNDYKNPKEALKKVLKDEIETIEEKKRNDGIIEKQRIIYMLEAERLAREKYIEDYTAPTQKVPELKKDGTPKMTGAGAGKSTIVYKKLKDKNGNVVKDEKGKDMYEKKSRHDIYTEQIAQQIKTEEEMRMELDKLRQQQENYKQQAHEFNQKAINIDNMQSELKQIKTYQESEVYLNRLNAIEKTKKEVEIKQQQNQHNKNMLELDKKMKALEVQSKVAAEFDPFQTTVAGVQTQIKSYGDNLKNILNSHLINIQNSKELDIQRENMHSVLESILDKYNGDDRTAANNNILELIKNKTNSKLPDNIDEFSLYNLQRATDFMKLINERNSDLLLSPKELDKFIREDTYKNFEWNNVE